MNRTPKAGDFLTSGSPADQFHTKVHVGVKPPPTVDETDAKFEEAARLQALLEQTRKAIAALTAKS